MHIVLIRIIYCIAFEYKYMQQYTIRIIIIYTIKLHCKEIRKFPVI